MKEEGYQPETISDRDIARQYVSRFVIPEYRKVMADPVANHVQYLINLFDAVPSMLIPAFEVVLDTGTSWEREGIEAFIGQAFETDPDEAAVLADRLLHDEDTFVAEQAYDYLHGYASRGEVIDPAVADHLMKTAKDLGIKEIW
jgi:hypothetical protein